MRMEPAVCRQKFDCEVAHLREQEATLRSWGIWLQEASFPDIFLVCVPRNHQVLRLPVVSPLVGVNGQQMIQFAVVNCLSLSGRAFGVRLGLDDFDVQPPSVTFVDAWTREPLSFDGMFRALHETESGQPMAVLHAPHPKTGLPFLCMRGVREYHEHPQHTGDDWLLYRGDLGAFNVVMTIWRTCMHSVQPHLYSVHPPQVNWEPLPRS